MTDMVFSKNSDLEKLITFALDRLEKKEILGVRASVDQASRIREFVETLCNVFDCKVLEKKTGHIKRCGMHMKIVRYTISANNLEFHDEFKLINI